MGGDKRKRNIWRGLQIQQRQLRMCADAHNLHVPKLVAVWEGGGGGTYASKRGLFSSDQVGRQAVHKPHHHVYSRNCVWVREVVEDGLVQQVKAHVQGVPTSSIRLSAPRYYHGNNMQSICNR